jgi:hypothetical protein
MPIALVLPVKDEALTLPELFDALALSPAWPAEIAFSDAGSADGTVASIRAWWEGHAQPGVVLHVIDNPGALPGAGRNAGIAATQAEWVAFLDGGIRPEPDWLQQLYRSVVAEGRDHAFGLCRFDANGALPLAVCALTNGVGMTGTVLPASIFHRQVFQTIGNFPAHLRSAEDLVWLRRFGETYGHRHICRDALVHYTHYPNTLTGIVRKWFAFERSSVAAGVGARGRLMVLSAALVFVVTSVLAPATALAGLLAYLILRGGVDPIRRSQKVCWWRKAPAALLLAPLCALAMDSGRVAGAVSGILSQASRKGAALPPGSQP